MHTVKNLLNAAVFYCIRITRKYDKSLFSVTEALNFCISTHMQLNMCVNKRKYKSNQNYEYGDII